MQGSNDIPEGVWLTSFGDLLTLLLGFFVATIALSPLNPASPKGKSAEVSLKNEGLRPEAVQAAAANQPGIGLASSSSKHSKELREGGEPLPFAKQTFEFAELADPDVNSWLEGLPISGVVRTRMGFCSSNLEWDQRLTAAQRVATALVAAGIPLERQETMLTVGNCPPDVEAAFEVWVERG
jgi:hypothetical protein